MFVKTDRVRGGVEGGARPFRNTKARIVKNTRAQNAALASLVEHKIIIKRAQNIQKATKGNDKGGEKVGIA